MGEFEGWEIPYRAEFDDAAQVFDLEPGDLVYWPQYSPHRVHNHDELNVSITTNHHDRAVLSTKRRLSHERLVSPQVQTRSALHGDRGLGSVLKLKGRRFHGHPQRGAVLGRAVRACHLFPCRS